METARPWVALLSSELVATCALFAPTETFQGDFHHHQAGGAQSGSSGLLFSLPCQQIDHRPHDRGGRTAALAGERVAHPVKRD